MAERRRTAVVKLEVSDSDADLLQETIDQFLWAANYVVGHSRTDDGYVETNKQTLHHRTYDDLRESTDLHSNQVQAARNRAADALTSVVERWKQGKSASMPTFTSQFLEFDKRSATFHDDYVSLATVDGRVECEYILPPPGDNPQTAYLRNDQYEVTSATLQYRERTDTFYLHIGTKAEVEPEIPDDGDAEHSTVLGVDLGIENIAVTSTGTFWSGDYLNHRRREYERVRGSLQQTGTESAHRTIEQIGDRESRWARDYLHRISQSIVQEALTHDCSMIAFEDLEGIRERMPGAKKFHTWAFNQLYEYVQYKATAHGIETIQVDPAYTSQRCSKCGTTLEANRPSQETFCCQKCGYEVHADYNAAKNTGFRLLRAGQKSPHGGATCHLALKSGTLNVNGEYSPTTS